MTKANLPEKNYDIENRIFKIRGINVMLDSDLAELYGISTGRLNEQVKRNIKRFPPDFMFQLSEGEWQILISQIAISSWGGRRVLPYVFSEQGIASLSGVINTDTAIKVNISIMRTFIKMRNFVSNNINVFKRLDSLEIKQNITDNKLNKVLKSVAKVKDLPKQGIFFDGQMFDAYQFVSDLIRQANKSMIIIDNYIDDSILTLLSKKKKNVKCIIYTNHISDKMRLDIKKFNEQYPNFEIKYFNKAHDRFIIIDQHKIYHIGASLKDLGKKWFAFSEMNRNSVLIMKVINALHRE
ncbi:MAG: ORF6N domain-containing protein [Candidatus Marinimicrobia bacterium]|nr:ORF6N domain-containing protein [Candidatus Neomarinimicrobiota bacterium]